MHTMDKEDGVSVGGGGRWNGQLSSGKGLGDCGTAIDTASARRVPQRSLRGLGKIGKDWEASGTGIREDVLRVEKISQQLNDNSVEKRLTGPISERVVSSRTFSIADLDGSIGGGLIKVAGILG